VIRRVVATLVLVGAVAVVASCASGGGQASAQRQAGAGPPATPAKVRGKPPVVLLILDEFPTESLLGADGRIDADRYPNFARLAAMSTWFRNSTTIYDSTPKAVPAILDARMPFKGEAPDTRDHSRSIYTLFGQRGYRVVDSEEATAICPRRYCRNARSRRPGILGNLNRRRPERFRAWVRSMRPGRPGLWVKHALFPHGPWMYLPDGKHVRPTVKDPVPGLASPRGFRDRGVTRFNEQRYTLQLGFTDREIGLLLDHLARVRMLDRATIAVTADHGYSWEVGVKDRRKVTRSNVDEIAPQPLFIKAPGQRRGRVSRAYVRTIDILPTMADILGIRINWRHDGRSAFSRTIRRRRIVRLPTRDFSRIIKISARAIERRRRANLRRRIRTFGTGAQSKLVFGDPFASVYRAGPHRELLGRPVSTLAVARPGRTRARVANARLTRSVNLRSQLIPTHIAGTVSGGRRSARRDVAVAVNGVVQAVAHTFYLAGSGKESFTVLVPEAALRQGRNDVRVFALSRRGRGLRLTPLGSN
jgi:sulfatase-like protein